MARRRRTTPRTRSRSRLYQPTLLDTLLQVALAWSRNASQIRLENARLELLHAQLYERKVATAQRIMKIRLDNDRRKLINLQCKALELAMAQPPLLGSGENALALDVCPNCGEAHPANTRTHCTNCGRQLTPTIGYVR